MHRGLLLGLRGPVLGLGLGLVGGGLRLGGGQLLFLVLLRLQDAAGGDPGGGQAPV